MKTNTAKKIDSLSQYNVLEKLDERGRIENPIILKAIQDDDFRRKLISNPKLVLESEFSSMLGKPVTFPSDFEIKIVEEDENTAYLVLPLISSSQIKLGAVDLDPDAGVAHYCTTVTCKPGYSC